MADSTRPAALTDVNGLVGVVSGRAIATLKARNETANTRQTRKRAKDAREFLNGDKRAPLPKTFYTVQGDTDSFRADPALPYQRAMNLVQSAQAKWPFAKRNAMDFGTQPEIIATKIETAINEVMRFRKDSASLYPWEASVDTVAIEGVAIVITVPIAAAWEQCEKYEDAKGTPQAKWQRDKQGRGRKNSHYTEHPKTRTFDEHRPSTQQAYAAYAEQWKARTPPVLYRLLGPQNYVPQWTPDGALAGVIVEQTFRKNDLLRAKWFWGEGASLAPAGDSGGDQGTGDTDLDADVTRLEYWGTDANGTPYVSYCIVDGGTEHAPQQWTEDGLISTTVDLSPYISRLPVALAHGLSWRGVANKDRAAVPITHFSMQDHLNVAALKTGAIVAGWSYGFPSGWIKRDPALGDGETPPEELSIEPLVYKEIDGEVIHNTITAFPPSIVQLIAMESDDATKSSPSDAASGAGGGASSGFDRSLAAGFSERAQFAVKDGPRQLFEDAASFTLEILCNWAEATGPIPILTNPSVPIGKGAGEGRRTILTFESDWAGGIYDMTGIFKQQRDDNPAQDQVNLEKVKQGMMTRLDYLEQAGIEDPAYYEMQLMVEKLEQSPLGQAALIQTVAGMSNDDTTEQLAKAEQAKLLAQLAPGMDPSQALPAGFGAGVTRPPAAPGAPGAPGGVPATTPPSTPGVPGVTMPSPVASSNAGAVAGYLQSGPRNRALAAGGAIPQPVGQTP